MAIKKIEGFEFDGSPNTTKLDKKGYKRLFKSDIVLGSDNLNGAAEDNVSLNSGGSQGYCVVVTSDYNTIDVGCPSCSSAYVSFGSYVKMPIYEVPLDTFGVIGFSLKVDNLNSSLIPYGFQDDSSNDGQIFFALGGLHNDEVNIVAGIRASDNHVYLKVVDTPIDLYTSTSSLTGTYGDKYRGFHNNDGTVIDTGFAVTTGTWYTIEIKYKFSESSGGQVLIYINGILKATTATNLDFTGPLRNAAFLCAMNSLVTNNPVQPEYANLTHYFDNFYQLDSTGTKNNDYLGSFVIRRVSANEDRVNEGYATTTPYVAVGTDDDDTNYVAISSGQREIYGLADLSNIGSRIRGVEYTYVTKFDTNPNSRIVPIVDYSSVHHSGYAMQIPVSGGGYFYHSIPIESSLVTGGDWARDEINSGYHGFTILS